MAAIQDLAATVDGGVLNGAYQAAGQCFVGYWSGQGAWIAMKPEGRAEIAQYIPKACLDFRAAINERIPLVAYHRLRVATLFLCLGDIT
jgi:hypothetical protein